MRVHVPLLLALSANSPFWRGDSTGLDSTRTPIFRAFPRNGIPPRYDDFEDWSRRIQFMMSSKVIGDYTYLWYDVRPHPNFGTVEIRCMDSQTRVEHTLGAHRSDPGHGQGAGRALRGRARSSRAIRTRCWTRTSGSPRGTAWGAISLTCPVPSAVPVPELARRVIDRLHPHAEELGSGAEFDHLEDILENGNGASRQVVVYEANHDLREVVREILDATVPKPAGTPGD